MKITKELILEGLESIGCPGKLLADDRRIVVTFDDADTFDYPAELLIEIIDDARLQITAACRHYEPDRNVYELCNIHNLRTHFFTAVAMPDGKVEMRRVFAFAEEVSRNYVFNDVLREAVFAARCAFEVLEAENEDYDSYEITAPPLRRQADELNIKRLEKIIIDLFGGAAVYPDETYVVEIERSKTAPVAFQLVFRIVDQVLHITAEPKKFVPDKALLPLANKFNELACPKAMVMNGKLIFGFSVVISEEVSDKYIEDGCIAPAVDSIFKYFEELYKMEPRSFFARLFGK